jgi:hypothetical protein
MPRRETFDWLALDGEGSGRHPHKYTFLAAAGEGRRFCIENRNGLSSHEALTFIEKLPAKRVFGFAISYDITMIVKDLPPLFIYALFRPDVRRLKKGRVRPITWKGHVLDYRGGAFQVGNVVVWDVFKFFQAKFTDALKNWKVGDLELIAEIERMKELRSEFDKLTPREIQEYCFNECEHLSLLVKSLVGAHEKAGLNLDTFYGAGSTASLILDDMAIEGRQPPEAMNDAVMRAFFGGRFENSRVGVLDGPIYNYDISSAYPYQCVSLPCLEHGKWALTTKEHHLEHNSVTSALVSCSLPVGPLKFWGLLPYRTMKDEIVFPGAGGTFNVWLPEYLAARRIAPWLKFEHAYIFMSECNHRPFEKVPELYRLRTQWGKDGAGIVMKLGVNALYGKLAQSIGNPKYNHWIWAGMITSGTRAQLLDALALHKDPANLYLVATDGIYSAEKLDFPPPRDTGTFDLAKPLGGWEEKIVKSGMFACRPGINFPLDKAERELEKIRGRGFGRKALMRNADLIMKVFLEKGIEGELSLEGVQRFFGAKTSVQLRPNGIARSDRYGSWDSYSPRLTFEPKPKRVKARKDNSLVLHRIPGYPLSAPYKGTDDEGINLLKELEDICDEQPD